MYVFCNTCDDAGCMLCDYAYEEAEMRSVLEEIEAEMEENGQL